MFRSLPPRHSSDDARVLTNGEYWDRRDIVDDFRTEPFVYWYERYLVDVVGRMLPTGADRACLIHVVGCGPGREIPFIHSAFPNSRIVASDMSYHMIEACSANLRKWNCSQWVELRCQPASGLHGERELADVVFTFGNLLTFVTPASERRKTLHALRTVLRPGGIIAGSVHHRWGRLAKSAFFLAQTLLHALRLTSTAVGTRIARTSRGATWFHYFNSAELGAILQNAGLGPATIVSLARLAHVMGRPYNLFTGSNLLLFAARAQ